MLFPTFDASLHEALVTYLFWPCSISNRFNEHPRADRAKRDQIDDERIKSHLERVVRGTVEEALNALPADVRDSDHRALSAARELGRGGTDRDVPGWGVDSGQFRTFRWSRFGSHHLSAVHQEILGGVAA